jgi:hypothetical protein
MANDGCLVPEASVAGPLENSTWFPTFRYCTGPAANAALPSQFSPPPADAMGE